MLERDCFVDKIKEILGEEKWISVWEAEDEEDYLDHGMLNIYLVCHARIRIKS